MRAYLSCLLSITYIYTILYSDKYRMLFGSCYFCFYYFYYCYYYYELNNRTQPFVIAHYQMTSSTAAAVVHSTWTSMRRWSSRFISLSSLSISHIRSHNLSHIRSQQRQNYTIIIISSSSSRLQYNTV